MPIDAFNFLSRNLYRDISTTALGVKLLILTVDNKWNESRLLSVVPALTIMCGSSEVKAGIKENPPVLASKLAYCACANVTQKKVKTVKYLCFIKKINPIGLVYK
jgi:hypothetical protein